MPFDTSFHARRDKTALVAASIRSAMVRGKLAGGFIVLVGAIVGALLSGFGIWTPHLTFITVAGALIASIVVSWVGAVAPQRAPLAALLFSVPIVLAIGFAAVARQWWGCVALLACMIIPFAALALYQFDPRKPDSHA
jgi:hypothetical protein